MREVYGKLVEHVAGDGPERRERACRGEPRKLAQRVHPAVVDDLSRFFKDGVQLPPDGAVGLVQRQQGPLRTVQVRVGMDCEWSEREGAHAHVGFFEPLAGLRLPLDEEKLIPKGGGLASLGCCQEW